MKTYLKTLERMFKKHVTRLLSIIFIVLVSVGFVSGIGSAVDKINYSLTDYYKAQNVSDFIVKSTGAGFSEGDVARMKERYGEDNVNAGASLDVDLEVDGETRLFRLYFFEGETTVNKRETLEVLPLSSPEYIAGAEESDGQIKELALGTEIKLNFKDILSQLAEQNDTELPPAFEYLPSDMVTRTVTVTSLERSPLAFGKDGEPSYKNGDIEIPDTIDGVNALEYKLEGILYLSSNVIPALVKDSFPVGDLYLAVENRGLFSAFSKNYNHFIERETAELSELLGEDIRVIPLSDNYSFASLHAYGEKVMSICWVLAAVFVLVTALVVLSTMTRLLDEERAQVACLRTLGYPAWRIIFKYLLFAAIATGIGGTGGYFVGVGIAQLLYIVFNFSYTMPPMTSHGTLLFFLIVFFIVVAATLVATAVSGVKMTSDTPANLLRPKVPKAGKKVFLERIPFLWNLLSFKYKSTTRNVLRFKSRFFMTVIAVAFSTALMLAGLSVLDLALFHGLESLALMAVSVVVVVFAGLLTAVVIYTLTNINISERNRELATLMVLGYHDGEVASYIYREIFIDTVIGIVVGMPLSLLLLSLIYGIMATGSIATFTWFWWIAAPVIVLLFTALVALILRRKIVKIDMNESLKAIE